jgi:hypothetical protein
MVEKLLELPLDELQEMFIENTLEIKTIDFLLNGDKEQERT